jgi:hypothetical protein
MDCRIEYSEAQEKAIKWMDNFDPTKWKETKRKLFQKDLPQEDGDRVREETELRSRLEAVLKRVTLAELQGLTVEEFSQLLRVFPSAADWGDLKLLHLREVGRVLQKHGIM